jgi:hypothetical protein
MGLLSLVPTGHPELKEGIFFHSQNYCLECEQLILLSFQLCPLAPVG